MRRIFAALLSALLCLGLSACSAPAPAQPETPAHTVLVSPAPLAAKEKAPWPLCRVYFDGLLSDRGYVRDGAAYLSPAALCAFLGLDCQVQADAQSFTLTLPGLTVRGRAGQETVQAGSRYLYTPEGWLYWEGQLYLPADALGRLFGLTIAVSEDGRTASLSPDDARLLDGSEGWYERRFRAEDIYWLEHIIVSESYQQPLAGQIGVGNVVLNRVASPLYPDTVMEVVIDREGGVQFDPAADGGVTMEPDEQSVLAARLCLEGYSTVGDCMYFLNPDKASSRWFEENLTEAVVIGNHVFYH